MVHALERDTASFFEAGGGKVLGAVRHPLKTKRFLALNRGKPPSMIHAGTYGGTLHYLKAVAAVGTTDATKVVGKMKEIPVDDFYTKGSVREDGRVMRPYYLLRVKTPGDSKYRFDYVKRLDTVPAEEAARPLTESACPMLKPG
jgi:branched-chain amino acid transport system substrate-binding protein